MTERINAMLDKYEKVKNDDLSAELVTVERLVRCIEEGRDAMFSHSFVFNRSKLWKTKEI